MNEERGRMERLWRLYRQGGMVPAITSMFNLQSAQQMAYLRSLMKEQQQAAVLETPLTQLEVVVFDLETTGFYPDRGDEIISIGAVRVRGTTVQENARFYSLVQPGREIPEAIVQLTGITNEMVLAAPRLYDALRRFLLFVQRKILVAHAAGHDKPFLNSALRRLSRANLTHRVLDTMMIARKIHPEWQPHDLDTLCARYHITVQQRHHALEDALATAHLWVCLIRELMERGIHSCGDLYVYCGKD
jgi:DNA polymerase-3 subunit epsilon